MKEEAHGQQRVDRNSRQAVCIPGGWLPQVCCSRGRRSSCCSPSSDSEGSPPPWHPPSPTGWRGTSAGSQRSAIADLEELEEVWARPPSLLSLWSRLRLYGAVF